MKLASFLQFKTLYFAAFLKPDVLCDSTYEISFMINSIITGTGSCIPEKVVRNEAFLTRTFLNAKGETFTQSNQEIVDKLREISTIEERRHAGPEQSTTDLAFIAAQHAIESAGIDAETLDYIIVAHNLGDSREGHMQSDLIPSLAARVKQRLGIRNPFAVAYDVLFGCPGWLQGLIQAHYYIQSGDARRVLVIGAEILSRFSDPYDRDSMLYADGAGAVILEATPSDVRTGILSHAARTDAALYSKMLTMGPSFAREDSDSTTMFLKMNGHRLYQYALTHVPEAIKLVLDKAQVPLSSISKVYIHQANGKMDDAILARLYAICDDTPVPENIMPMSISKLGNSSVATIPTLLDLVWKQKMLPHQWESGSEVIFASVGAGMSINAMLYQIP